MHCAANSDDVRNLFSINGISVYSDCRFRKMASLYLRMLFLVYGTVVLSDARRKAIKVEEWTRPNHRLQGAYHFHNTLNLKRASENTLQE